MVCAVEQKQAVIISDHDISKVTISLLEKDYWCFTCSSVLKEWKL